MCVHDKHFKCPSLPVILKCLQESLLSAWGHHCPQAQAFPFLSYVCCRGPHSPRECCCCSLWRELLVPQALPRTCLPQGQGLNSTGTDRYSICPPCSLETRCLIGVKVKAELSGNSTSCTAFRGVSWTVQILLLLLCQNSLPFYLSVSGPKKH